MRFYKIIASVNSGDKPAPEDYVIWAGSLTEAAKARKDMAARGAARKDTETFELDIPTSKDGLLAWLNTNANK